MSIEQKNGESYISGAYLTERTLLNDFIETEADLRFRVLGRHSDIVNIAGKRASLADLNRKLTDIPGISDGVFFNPDEQIDNVTRLTAFVVAPEMDKQQIQAALGKVIDAAFLPRPLHKLDTLPRAATGKIPRTELIQLYQNLCATHE
jgi:acyl-coenzyme A synthetase/AMP-(fatty) acid ligase